MTTKHLNAYPTTEAAARWSETADALDMGTSEFICAMVEAGLKKFDATTDPDDRDLTADVLREQRDDARDEADRLRARVRALEDRLADTDAAATYQYVLAQPGASFADVLGYVRDTSVERVPAHIDAAVADGVIRATADGGETYYHPVRDHDHDGDENNYSDGFGVGLPYYTEGGRE
ncbi:hypothetical protein [Halomarina rubra]|uniref:Uncharacterized protein n=1 Tax=Halomarina rubra TaxID=2071873 RepID=A0ABD6ATB9_9EURY|nr:hypothetical protein [Halomarina rubra]